jgi:hypothetical protein
MSISLTAPTAPYVIRFEDNRCVGGYSDIEYPTEEEARKGWVNLKRKNAKTNAELWVVSVLIDLHYRKP